jgi:pimeloyl-ACP methyl ester carboxylesterase
VILRNTLPPGRLIDVGGYRLHIFCTGEKQDSTPTVVLEGGLGATSIVWQLVQERLQASVRVCSYDRAGYGWSDPGLYPRTGEQIAAELHTLLTGAGENPPYILVGHSLGGILIRLYAGAHPAEVLVDARHEDFFVRMPHQFLQTDQQNFQRARLLCWTTPLGFTRLLGNFGLLDTYAVYIEALPEEYKAAAYSIMFYNSRHWQTTVAEREVIEQTYDGVRGVSLPSDLRVIVLTADNGADAWRAADNSVDSPSFQIWMELQEALTKLTLNSKWVRVPNSGHYIYLEHPDAVADAVLEIFRGG